MVGVVYLPWLAARIFPLDWQWAGGHFGIHYGELLSVLPGVVLTPLLAPRVAYRRRDALTLLLFPPAGIRLGWIVGTRMGQLPHRDWPERTDVLPLQGRQAARIAVTANRYRNWRQRRVGQAGTLPQNGCATYGGEHSSSGPSAAEVWDDRATSSVD